MSLSREQVESRAEALASAFEEAARRNQWAWIADAFYAEQCTYLCEYGGTMRVFAANRDEIRATHYGRDMLVGWEGWSFPIERYTTHGNRIITHWWNRGPGRRADGSYFQTPGVSFITVGDDGMFTDQLDLFDLAHQMHLCDELDDTGLLSPQLKENWVIPTKRRLIAMLSRNLPVQSA
ncbi:nuclear transport factor 2 family protein [Sinimarinibacterium sp. CAU 1509]|uniref:nuclear transport factor 2 family protein n=1 Tax=Sinimarinibacterium sp. CAU 1509 TaxID=2562283 RepID=UPI0010AD53B3|nr:nuclear transport factor 2 family protein [Sinimarinibacterium sp. CAU 1509]TJY64996.1 nuclear transport factor 2 family protein [Sinimarinibacterium sp. CAU 1509]